MKKGLGLVVIIIMIAFINLQSVSALSSTTTLNCNNTLNYGSTGEQVKILQTMLNEVSNCGLAVDGVFGNLTYNCTKLFQAQNNLAVDGIVGINTCTKLNSKITTPEVVHKRGVVTGNGVNIRKKASLSAKVLKVVPLGSVFTVYSETQNWYKVKINNKKYGYINKAYFKTSAILLDISDQKLYLFKDGVNTLSTKVVTGMKNYHDTPVGSYVLYKYNLQTNTTLRGYNDNGTTYAAHVDYWMPFIPNRGIGFHDATWRGTNEFTQDRYTYDGSHGCVNMLYGDAQYLYNSITNDINVVVRS